MASNESWLIPSEKCSLRISYHSVRGREVSAGIHPSGLSLLTRKKRRQGYLNNLLNVTYSLANGWCDLQFGNINILRSSLYTYICNLCSTISVHVAQWLVSISLVIRRLQVVHICNLCSTISVHVAQWLEHLTGHQKVTGCTHMYPLLYHPSSCSSMVRYRVYIYVTFARPSEFM